MKKIFLVCSFLLIPVLCFGASVDLKWEAVAGAAGYRIYQSTNNGTNWPIVRDVGNVLSITLTDVPDTGLVHFRFSAYNAQNETIRMNVGVWFNGTWTPLAIVKEIGIR